MQFGLVPLIALAFNTRVGFRTAMVILSLVVIMIFFVGPQIFNNTNNTLAFQVALEKSVEQRHQSAQSVPEIA